MNARLTRAFVRSERARTRKVDTSARVTEALGSTAPQADVHVSPHLHYRIYTMVIFMVTSALIVNFSRC